MQLHALRPTGPDDETVYLDLTVTLRHLSPRNENNELATALFDILVRNERHNTRRAAEAHMDRAVRLVHAFCHQCPPIWRMCYRPPSKHASAAPQQFLRGGAADHQIASSASRSTSSSSTSSAAILGGQRCSVKPQHLQVRLPAPQPGWHRHRQLPQSGRPPRAVASVDQNGQYRGEAGAGPAAFPPSLGAAGRRRHPCAAPCADGAWPGTPRPAAPWRPGAPAWGMPRRRRRQRKADAAIARRGGPRARPRRNQRAHQPPGGNLPSWPAGRAASEGVVLSRARRLRRARRAVWRRSSPVPPAGPGRRRRGLRVSGRGSAG